MQNENSNAKSKYDNYLFERMWENFISHAPQKNMNLIQSGDIFYLETINNQDKNNKITETKYRPIIMVRGLDIKRFHLNKYFFGKVNNKDIYGIPLTTSSDPDKLSNQHDLKLENDLKITFRDNKSYKVPQGKPSYIRGIKIFKFSQEEQGRIKELKNHPLNYQRFLIKLNSKQLTKILKATRIQLNETILGISQINPKIQKHNKLNLHPNPTIISIEAKHPDNPRKDLPPKAINEPDSHTKNKDTDTSLDF